MTWPTLETDRLVLRPLIGGDLDALAPLHAQESFWWYPLGRGMSRAETESFLDRQTAAYEDPGVGLSAIVVRSSMQLVGWAGLSVPSFLPEVLPAVEVGWRLGEQFRGNGYAQEAGAAWLRFGFEALGLDEIISIYEPENEASGKVMQRLGLTLREATTHPDFGVELWVLSLTRARWAVS